MSVMKVKHSVAPVLLFLSFHRTWYRKQAVKEGNKRMSWHTSGFVMSGYFTDCVWVRLKRLCWPKSKKVSTPTAFLQCVYMSSTIRSKIGFKKKLWIWMLREAQCKSVHAIITRLNSLLLNSLLWAHACRRGQKKSFPSRLWRCAVMQPEQLFRNMRLVGFMSQRKQILHPLQLVAAVW